jgi:hypothetical protein
MEEIEVGNAQLEQTAQKLLNEKSNTPWLG